MALVHETRKVINQIYKFLSMDFLCNAARFTPKFEQYITLDLTIYI
jgi:hypothetical protein